MRPFGAGRAGRSRRSDELDGSSGGQPDDHSTQHPRRRATAPLRSARLLLTMGVLGGALAACGSGSSPAASGGGKPTTGKVNLTYALWDPHEQVGYQQSIDEFMRIHPNIHVTIENIPYAQYEAKLTQEFTAGTGPDLYWVNTPFLARWEKDGVMMNLAARIKAAGIPLSQYYPALVKLHTSGSAIYGLPKDWDTIAVYYNKAYFATHHLTPPTSWSWNPNNGGSFLHFLQEATYDTAGQNALSPSFDPSKVATYAINVENDPQPVYQNYLAENGVVVADAGGHKALFDTPAGIATFQFLRNLMYKWHVAPPGSELGANASNPSSQDISLFAQGQIAMLMEGDWNTVPVAQAVKFPVGVLPLPAGPDGTVSVFNGLIDAINVHTPHPNSAWLLEQWLGSPASERILGQGGYVWPGIKSLDPLFLDHWRAAGIDMQPFLTEASGKTVEFPVTPGMNTAFTDMTNQLGPLFLNSGSTAAAVAAAAQAANTAFSQAQSGG